MSVIRRKHTKNFTTISNALRNDERLAADEVGILYYLLTQHHDWEIRRPQLRKRWKLGRDGMKRVMDNWLRTGWLHAEKTRLSTSQFTIVYEVRDEPGPTLSDEEVTAALSMVSIEVGSDESTDEGGTESTGPPTPQPYLDGRLADTRGWEESLNTDSINTNPTKRGVVWIDLQKAWPPDDILSPLVCEKLFAALSPKDQRQAIGAAGAYLANCRAKNRKICDLSTYLKERRFDRPEAAPNGALWETKPGTPGAHRWLESGQLSHWQVAQLGHGRAITTPTQFPKSTGPPPVSLMSSEDQDHI